MSLFESAREKYRPHGITIRAAAGEYRIKHRWDDEEYTAEDFDEMIEKADELVANPPPKPPPPPGPEASNRHPRAVVRRTNKKNRKTLLERRQKYTEDLRRWREGKKS